MTFLKIIFFSFLILPQLVKAKSNKDVSTQTYTIDLSDWPQDVTKQMKNEVPELLRTDLNEEDINHILKILDQKMSFESLRALKTHEFFGNSEKLKLAGEITARIDQIEFKNLTDLSESEALSLMNLTKNSIFDEEALKQASQKLSQFYHDQGYRFAEVSFTVKGQSTLKKSIVFNLNLQKQTRLTAVQIEGLDPATKNDIEKQFQIFFFRPVLNDETLNKINLEVRKQLSLHGYFLTPVTEPQIQFAADELTAKVLFKLQNTTSYSIEILNAKEFSRAYLETEVLKLDHYASNDINFATELIDKLKSFYRNEGFPHLEINYYERKEGSRIIVTLNLNEGPFTQLQQLQFTGQLSRPESFYQNRFFELASPKLRRHFFLKEDIDLTLKNLVTDLQNEGYVNARLGRIQMSTDREKPQIGRVVVQLDEGQAVQLSTVEFSGLKNQATTALLKIMHLNLNQALSLVQLEAALNQLKNHYTSLGFLEFKILNEQKDLITYSEENTKAHLKIEVYEGPRVEVQSIAIEGNDLSKDKLVFTEIEFKVGSILTPSLIEESIARLQRTGHFSSVDIYTLEAGTDISQRTIVIKLIERDPGIFTIGGGATNENKGTVRGYTGVAYRNIGGWGRGLSARFEGNYNFADVKYLETKFTLGGVEPYLMQSRARLRVNVTRSRSISDYSLRKVTELNSGVISVEQDFTSHFTGIWDLLSVSTYIDHGIDHEDEIKNNYERTDLVIGSTGPRIDIDYRDNFFNPTRGSFSQLSIEYATEALSSHKVDDFIRTTGQTTWYFPFQKSSIVLAQSFRGGYIQDLHKTGYGIPFSKKGFSLGGRSTVRGFESGEYYPSEVQGGDQYIGVNYALSSFASYELIKTELRFPIVQGWDLTAAVFYDGGQVNIDGVEFTDKWRDAVGLGFRYNTPIGPLNLEYGHKLDKKEGESEGAFHLSVGVF